MKNKPELSILVPFFGNFDRRRLELVMDNVRAQSKEGIEFLICTEKKISLGKLKDALRKLSERDNQEFHFWDIEWDGRNESLIWGREKLFPEIEKFLNKTALL